MGRTPIDDTDARTLRDHWFRYLDTLEPLRPELYGYCRRLTGSVWDAEDLVQDTLLKGFAMTARGDFHGPDSPVRNARAYLFRTATNGWIDTQRRLARVVSDSEPVESTAPSVDTVVTREAVTQARARTSAAEFASLLLKDVYDFTLEEIADFVGTTTGTVKSALHRARQKVREEVMSVPAAEDADRALAAAFADAINSQDVDRVLGMMAETLQIIVANVGGGRGKSRLWTEPTVAAASTAACTEVDGRWVVILSKNGRLYDVLGLAGDDGRLTRLTDYCYAPDVLAEVAERLDYPYDRSGYHQAAHILPGMIDTTTLPWRHN